MDLKTNNPASFLVNIIREYIFKLHFTFPFALNSMMAMQSAEKQKFSSN